jgi:hypothetical protein
MWMLAERGPEFVAHRGHLWKSWGSCTAKAVAQSNIELVSAEPFLNLGIFELQSDISGEPADYFLETGARRRSPHG